MPPLSPASRSAHLLGYAFLLLAPVAYGLLTLSLGMDANWDLRNYHWYNGYALLTGRIDYDILPAQMPSFYNPLLDAVFFLLADRLPARVAGFLWGTLQGINLSLLFLIARSSLRIEDETKRVLVAMVLAAMGGLGGGALGLVGTTFHDNVVSLGVLTALAIVLPNLPRLLDGAAAGAFGRVAVAGLAAGTAMGLKNPMGVYAVGLCLAFLTLPTGIWRRLWLAFFFGIGVLGGLALFGGFWMAHLWHDYGNPLFPHMNQIFKSPYAAISSYVNVSFFPTSLTERLFFPVVFTFDPLRVGEVPWFDLRILSLFVLIPAAALCAATTKLFRIRNDGFSEAAVARYLLVAASVAYGLWLTKFCIYRYLLPLEMLAPLLLVIAAGLVPVRQWIRILAVCLVLVTVQATARPADWGRIPWTDRWVETKVPAIEDPDDTMVLMAGYWAISHVIPSFPPRIPFVRIQSNFLQPDSVGNGYLAIMKDRIAAHRGRFLMLSTIPDTAGAAKAAALLNLRLDPNDCRAIANNLGEPLNLCAVHRVAVE